MYDGDAQRDAARSLKGLELLVDIARRAQAGEIHIVDCYVNASVSDPYRMNIEIKTVRGNNAPDNFVPVRLATIDPRAAPPDKSAARRYELERRRKEARLQTTAEWAANADLWSPGQEPKKAPPAPPAPPRPKIDRSKGAREIDLD